MSLIIQNDELRCETDTPYGRRIAPGTDFFARYMVTVHEPDEFDKESE